MCFCEGGQRRPRSDGAEASLQVAWEVSVEDWLGISLEQFQLKSGLMVLMGLMLPAIGVK